MCTLRIACLTSAYLLVALPFAPARAAGDAAKGQEIFATNCADCHTTTHGGKNKKGPNLFGIVGRPAGSIPDFEYTDANKNSGVVWTPDVLNKYLTAPKKFIIDTKMKFDGLPDAAERADLIAYLETLK